MKKIGLHIILLLLPVIINSQNLTLKPDKHEIKLGEQIKVCVVLSAPDSAALQMPLSVDIMPREVMIVEEFDADTSFYSDAGKNLIEINKKFIITSFDTGVHEVIFPPAHVDGKEVNADKFFIAVEDTEVDPEANFADAKPSEEFPYTVKEILLIIGKYLLIAWAVVIFIAVITYFLGKDKKSEFEDVPEEPKTPPHITALEAIAQLEKSELLEKGKYKKYHIKLSLISRRYLEDRFEVSALESTTNEIKAQLRAVSIEGRLKETLVRSLSISDLAKFAKVIPTLSENDFAVKAAKEFIEETKITEETNE